MAAPEGDPLDAPMEVVTFGSENSIRGVVEKYLRDPDLWPAILAMNGISSTAELRPGVELRLLIDSATRDAAGLEGFSYDSLDPIQLKGYAQPVPAFAARRVAG